MNISFVQLNTTLKFAPVAWAIKFFQKTKYSHYAIKVSDANGVYYYDSTAAGARKQNAATYLKKYTIYKTFKLKDPVSYIDFYDFWAKHEGKGYAYGQILGIALKVLNILRYNPFGKGAKRLICNELIILFLEDFGYIKIKDSDEYDLVETEEILKKVL
jgi:hypothetical protein